VQKLSKFWNFENQSPLTYKLQRGHMHIIHQITSTLRALSDGDVHFCKNSKFVDILGVKCAEIVKIRKCQKSIAINIETSARTYAYHTSNCIYSSSSFRWWCPFLQKLEICWHFRWNVQNCQNLEMSKINRH
jgi:hypothetical protein